ncbi:aldose 1-epimerase [Peribacillus butanolivorans]|uniref:aldose 1-epimerase n=1 Tax=Peribacillus butanolivorans TaxID=421767 RepID=UPI00367073C2
MTGYIEDITFLNEKAIRFGNETLEAILVPVLGSNLLSFKFKQNDIELLRTPKTLEDYREVPILYGMPILFPPNRIEGGQFTYKQITYKFPINEIEKSNHIHGLLYDKPWQVIKREVNGEKIVITTEFLSSDFPFLKRYFPHDFTINMTFSLNDNALDVQLEIINNGQEPFPWGVGFHTIFNFPFVPSSKLMDCRISLPVNKQWELNDRSLPTGKIQATPNTMEIQNGFSIEGQKFDDIFGYDEDLENECVLTDQEAGLQVCYHGDDHFKFWVLFNQKGFVCPEPYTWVTNAPNLDLSAELTGLRELGPGERVRLRTKLSLKQI